jgi:hypothetical protein
MTQRSIRLEIYNGPSPSLLPSLSSHRHFPSSSLSVLSPSLGGVEWTQRVKDGQGRGSSLFIPSLSLITHSTHTTPGSSPYGTGPVSGADIESNAPSDNISALPRCRSAIVSSPQALTDSHDRNSRGTRKGKPPRNNSDQ